MKKRDNLPNENRESARIPDSFKVNYKVITQEEFDEKAPFYINRRTSNRPSTRTYDTDAFSLDWASLEYDADYNPFLVKIFSYMDKKLDMIFFRQEEILKQLAPQNQKQEKYKSGESIDISGSGIGMFVTEELKKDTILKLDIEPPIFPPIHIVALGKLARVSPGKSRGKTGYKVSTTFTAINEDDREELIKYIFKRQRELISSKKRTDEFL